VEGIRLEAIVTNHPERRAAALRRYPSTRLYHDAANAFDKAGCDLAVISIPNRYHIDLANLALNAGLNVVVDKPMAGSASQARALFEHANRRGLVAVAYHNRRWDGDFCTLDRLVKDGQLGTVYRFESRFERWHPSVTSTAWKESSSREDLGGVLYDLGVHLIDQAVCLFGRPIHVYAELDRHRRDTKVDDDTYLALEHKNGVRSHLWVSWAACELGPRFRVLGSMATYVKYGTDCQAAALRSGAAPGSEEWGAEPTAAWGSLRTPRSSERIPTLPGGYQNFYSGVIAAITQGHALPVAVSDVIDVLDVIDAARRSAHSHAIEGMEPSA
jgi:predicted dehydrogenase